MRLNPVHAFFFLAIVLPITAAAAEQVGNSGAATVDGSYIWVDLNGGNHYCPPDCGGGADNVRDREAGARAWLLAEADTQAALRSALTVWNNDMQNFRCPGPTGVDSQLAFTQELLTSHLDMASFNRNAAVVNGGIPGGANLARLSRQLANEQERSAGLMMEMIETIEAYLELQAQCGSSSSRSVSGLDSARAAAEAEEKARLLEEEIARFEALEARTERERQALENARDRIANIMDDLSTQVTADLDRRATDAVALTPAATAEPLEFVDVGTRLVAPGNQDSAPVPMAFLDPSEIVVDPLAARGADSSNGAPLDPSFRTNVLLDALEYGNQNWEVSIDYLERALFDELDPQKEQAIWDALNYTKGIYAEVRRMEAQSQYQEIAALVEERDAGIDEATSASITEAIELEFQRTVEREFLEMLQNDPQQDAEIAAMLSGTIARLESDGDVEPDLLSELERLRDRLAGEDSEADASIQSRLDRIQSAATSWLDVPGVITRLGESYRSLRTGDFEAAFQSVEDAYKRSPNALALRHAMGYLLGLTWEFDMNAPDRIVTEGELVDIMNLRLVIIERPQAGEVR